MKISIRIVTALASALAAIGAPAFGKSQVKAEIDTPQTAPQQGSGPDGAVRALYAPYLPGGDERMSAFDNDAERSKRFSASLAGALKEYFQRQAKASDPGALDFDPIVNGQDYKIEDLQIRTGKTVPGKSAAVIAEFKNSGESVRIQYNLVFEGGAWRVDGMTSMADPVWDLRALMKAD